MCLFVQFLVKVAHVQLRHWNLTQVLNVVILVCVHSSFLQVLFMLDACVLEGCLFDLGITAVIFL